jgi:hypothetical protein
MSGERTFKRQNLPVFRGPIFAPGGPLVRFTASGWVQDNPLKKPKEIKR